MANMSFMAWTRSTAFNLSLNDAAIHQLLFMYGCEVEHRAAGRDPSEYGDMIFDRSRWAYLTRRGLITRIERPGYEHNYMLTPEGFLVAQLLQAAGFKTRIGVFEEPAAI